jgi:hypothetical protein
MSQNFYGSICITDILNEANNLHPSFSKGKNGKIYLNVTMWLNDQPDQFGNMVSVKISDKNDVKGAYIGNLKKGETKDNSINQSDVSSLALNADIPSLPGAVDRMNKETTESSEDDGLPF